MHEVQTMRTETENPRVITLKKWEGGGGRAEEEEGRGEEDRFVLTSCQAD